MFEPYPLGVYCGILATLLGDAANQSWWAVIALVLLGVIVGLLSGLACRWWVDQ